VSLESIGLAPPGPRNGSTAQSALLRRIGLHAASSIYLMSQYAATQAGKSMRLRIHVPGFDAVCRMAQANMGIGVIPDRAFDVVGAGMGLRSIGSATNRPGENSRSSCVTLVNCRLPAV
jgi:DNA-binding transcriptional LysR family regulator